MTDVVISATPVAPSTEAALIHLTLNTRDDDWVGEFDRLQVFRSVEGPAGPWEELTAADWLPPRIPKTAGPRPSSPVSGGLVNAVGSEFVFLLNYQTKTITITGSNPLTMAQVADQIETESSGFLTSYVDATGQLVVEGVFPGLQSRLMVLPSDGAILVGLPTDAPESESVGRNPRLGLEVGKTAYELIDFYGSRQYYYRSRYIHSATGAQSEPSIPHLAGGVGVPAKDIIIGYVELVDGRGVPMQNEVRLYTESNGTPVGGKLLVNSTQVKYADANGRAEFHLLRGQRVTVAVMGTSTVRTVTVPTDESVTEFNLLDPALGPYDFFRAAVPELISAERRTP